MSYIKHFFPPVVKLFTTVWNNDYTPDVEKDQEEEHQIFFYKREVEESRKDLRNKMQDWEIKYSPLSLSALVCASLETTPPPAHH